MLYVTECFPVVLPKERGCSGMLDKSGKSTVMIPLSLSASRTSCSTLFLLSTTFCVVDVDEMLMVGEGDNFLIDFEGFLLADVDRILLLELVGNLLLGDEETLLADIEGRSTVMLLMTLLIAESISTSLLGTSPSVNWFP